MNHPHFFSEDFISDFQQKMVDSWQNFGEQAFQASALTQEENPLHPACYSANMKSFQETVTQVYSDMSSDLKDRLSSHGYGGSPSETDFMKTFFPTFPGLGIHREEQENQQDLSEAFAKASQSTTQLVALIQRSLLESWQAFQLKYLYKSTTLRSPREVYDLWVACAEESHEKLIKTQSYQKCYGDYVNQSMALQKKLNDQMNRWLKTHQQPTRDDFLGLSKKVQELQREMNHLREQVAASARQDSQETVVRKKEASNHKKGSAKTEPLSPTKKTRQTPLSKKETDFSGKKKPARSKKGN